jgi:hypothetical protein
MTGCRLEQPWAFCVVVGGESGSVEYNGWRTPLSEDASVSAGRHRRRRLRGRGPIVLLVILALLGAGGAGSAYAAYQYDQARVSRILPGITVGGVAVGNMARDQAIQAVERTADRTLERRLTIKAGRRSWQLPLSSLGLSVDVSAAVDRALSLSQGYSWVSRVYHRLAHKPVNQSVPLGYSF